MTKTKRIPKKQADRPKKKAEIVFIKILHSSLMGNLFSGSSFDGDTGDVVRALYVTEEMRKKHVADGHYDTGPGYVILRDRGFINKAFATTDISDADYRKAIKKLEKEQSEQIEKKKKIDKNLNWTSRALVSFRKQRKALKQQ